MTSKRPVRPRHAASLVLLRETLGTTEVLMGRRPPRSAFIPDAFVFPGGRLDPQDAHIPPGTELSPDEIAKMKRHGGCSERLARALATAAIRETFEETGLLIAAPARNMPSEHETSTLGTSVFGAPGALPALDRLRFLGRAITPASSPIRYHARFFSAGAEGATGTLRGSGELLDLDWYPLATALKLPIIDVTQFILTLIAQGRLDAQGAPPFFRYRRNKPLSEVSPDLRN